MDEGVLLFRLPQRQIQLIELCLVDVTRGVEHHVAAGVVLREGDVVADRLRPAEQRAQAVEPERQSAVRGRAVLESVHQEAEALLRLVGREAQQFEHLLLQLRVVDTDRTAADLRAVADEVVGVGTHAARVAVEELDVLEFGRGEGVVHGVVTLRLVVPLEQREVHHPQRGELLRVAQAQLLGHFEAQGAELRQRLELLAAEDEDHVPGHSAAALGHGAHLLGGVELVDRRLHAALLDANPDEALGADLLPLDELRQRVDLFAGVCGAARGGESGDVFGFVEDREAVTLGQVGDVRELHAEPQVGFVRAVFLHRLDPRHAAQRLGQFDVHHVFEHVLGPAFENLQHVLLLDERHFAVDLRELGLAVGAQVFVAEAAHDLEILVVAGDHQQLLERLRRLGQGVELVGRHAARHDEVAGASGVEPTRQGVSISRNPSSERKRRISWAILWRRIMLRCRGGRRRSR